MAKKTFAIFAAFATAKTNLFWQLVNGNNIPPKKFDMIWLISPSNTCKQILAYLRAIRQRFS
jgi:hypothetical protein